MKVFTWIEKFKYFIIGALLIGLGGYCEAESQQPLTKIIEREIVEWSTVSRTTPVCDMVGCLVMHFPTFNQRGTKYAVKFAQIKWKGEIKEIELERFKIETTEVLERKISENPYSPYRND